MPVIRVSSMDHDDPDVDHPLTKNGAKFCLGEISPTEDGSEILFDSRKIRRSFNEISWQTFVEFLERTEGISANFFSDESCSM